MSACTHQNQNKDSEPSQGQLGVKTDS